MTPGMGGGTQGHGAVAGGDTPGRSRLPSQAADKLIRVFAEQIFYTGFIHADPHPGNGNEEVGGMSPEIWG